MNKDSIEFSLSTWTCSRFKSSWLKSYRNGLAHRWFLIDATMPIVFMLEIVLSYLFSMVESSCSSLLLIHRQIVSREDLTGLGHISQMVTYLICDLRKYSSKEFKSKV